jgi:hypothetical protein
MRLALIHHWTADLGGGWLCGIVHNEECDDSFFTRTFKLSFFDDCL